MGFIATNLFDGI